MIKIWMYNSKWRIGLGDEIWEFEKEEDFKQTLLTLIELKQKFGRINHGI